MVGGVNYRVHVDHVFAFYRSCENISFKNKPFILENSSVVLLSARLGMCRYLNAQVALGCCARW